MKKGNICTRHRLSVGSKVEIHNKVRVGIDTNGIPCWRMALNMGTTINGEYVAYDYIWIKEQGQFRYKVGDWVRITSILGFSSSLKYSHKGGRIIFRILDVTTEKVENNGVENDEDIK